MTTKAGASTYPHTASPPPTQHHKPRERAQATTHTPAPHAHTHTAHTAPPGQMAAQPGNPRMPRRVAQVALRVARRAPYVGENMRNA